MGIDKWEEVFIALPVERKKKKDAKMKAVAKSAKAMQGKYAAHKNGLKWDCVLWDLEDNRIVIHAEV